MTEKEKNVSLLCASADGRAPSQPLRSTTVVGPTTTPSAVIMESMATGPRVTPHTGHRETIAMSTSATSNTVPDHLLASSAPSSSSPLLSLASSLGVQVPLQLQGGSKRPLFLSHSLSRDGEALKRIEEADEKKRKNDIIRDTEKGGNPVLLPMHNENIIFGNHPTSARTVGEAASFSLSTSPGGRRETAHTMQRRKSSTLLSVKSTTTTEGGGKEREDDISIAAPFSSVVSHSHVSRASLGIIQGGPGSEREGHKDPQYIFGSLASSAPTGIVGIHGKPLGFSSQFPFNGSFHNNSMNTTTSVMDGGRGGNYGLEAKMGMTLAGSNSRGFCRPHLASSLRLGGGVSDELPAVEFPMRLRRGPLSVSPSSSVLSGGGVPSPLIHADTSNFMLPSGAGSTAVEEGMRGAIGSAPISEDGAQEGIEEGAGAVARPTLHSHLREEAAAAVASTMHLSSMKDAEDREAEEKRELEEKQAKKGPSTSSVSAEKQQEKAPSMNSAQLLSQAGTRTAKSGNALLINYWKSKNVFQMNMQATDLNSSSRSSTSAPTMVGGYSVPVGLHTAFPTPVTHISGSASGEKEERAALEGEAQSEDNQLSEKKGEPNKDRWAEGDESYGISQQDALRGLGIVEAPRFSLATSVPAFFRGHSSANKCLKQYFGNDYSLDVEHAATAKKSVKPEEKLFSNMPLAMSSSLGMSPKRTTMHAVLRDGLPFEGDTVNPAHGDGQFPKPRRHSTSQISGMSSSASTSSMNRGPLDGAGRRNDQGSVLNPDHYESGEYAT